MKKEEFYFDSRDGIHKIHAVRYTPDSGEVKGVVQVIHGMAEYAERYEEFARFLTEKGYVVTGEDHLGHGKSVGEDKAYGYFCQQDPATVLVRDAHRLKKMTQGMYPGTPYLIAGHSMGSYILRNYICRYGTGIDGAIILGTGMPGSAFMIFAKFMVKIQKVFCGPKHVSRVLDRLTFMGYNGRIQKPETKSDWISTDGQVVKEYMADPACGFVFTVNGFETISELISRIRKEKNLANMPQDLPILMLSGEDDPVGEYGAGVERAYASLVAAGMTKVQKKIYAQERHELLTGIGRQEVMRDIYEWVGNLIQK